MANSSTPAPGAIQDAPTAYRVDWPRLVVLLLPALLRRPKLVAWLQLLTGPVANLHITFIGYLYASRRQLSYSSQVMAFERALNDRFDPSRRRIRIRNADTEYSVAYDNFRYEEQPEQYMLLRREMPPWAYDRTWSEYSGQTDYTVVVPTYLQPRALEIRALINRFNPATKHYTVLFQNTTV